MKRKTEHRHDVRFDQELEEAILKIEPRTRQFSAVVRRLCRIGLSRGSPNSYHQVLVQLETIRLEVAPIGGNLNQIAKAFNLEGHLFSEELSVVHFNLQSQFAEMTDVLKELRYEIYNHIR